LLLLLLSRWRKRNKDGEKEKLRERESARTIRKLEEKIGHREFCIDIVRGTKKNIQEILFKKKKSIK